MNLDRIDRRLLALLQADATLPISTLADSVGLSQTPCWKRLKRLSDEGVIRSRVALVDPVAVGLPLVAFVSLTTSRHDQAWLETFAAAASALPEIVEFYRMSGQVDYLLKVRVADIAAYDRFYKRLIACAPLADVSSAFCMEEIKVTTALHLEGD